MVVAGDGVAIAPVDRRGPDGRVQAVTHVGELDVFEWRGLAGLTIRFRPHVPTCREGAAARDRAVGIALRGESRGRGEKQKDRRSGHKTNQRLALLRDGHAFRVLTDIIERF